MAANPPRGDNHRQGAVRGRSQVYNSRNHRWVKRSRESGQFPDFVDRFRLGSRGLGGGPLVRVEGPKAQVGHGATPRYSSPCAEGALVDSRPAIRIEETR